jgi:hypothetical protein
MIANPYLLKKHNQPLQKKQLDELNINHNLYIYLHEKYPNIYISPTDFYDIISTIDNKIMDSIVDKVLREVIDTVIVKFDNEVI